MAPHWLHASQGCATDRQLVDAVRQSRTYDFHLSGNVMTTKQMLTNTLTFEHNALGHALRTARKAANLSQTELATMLNVRQTDISIAERGDTHVKETVIYVHGPRESTQKMAEFLKIKL
jgi:ribosome-binding protein aMBF1 (putative translation factor)